MVALLLAALAAPPPIVATGSERPTRVLAARADVAKLCQSLLYPERRRDPHLDRAAAEADQQEKRARALEGRYQLEIAGRGLSFDYDEERQVLALDERAQLVGAGGALRVWASEREELELPASPALARRIAAAARNGEGRLRLTFVLPEDEEAAVCAHAPGTQSWGLGVEPVAWAFLVKEEVLARGGGEEPVPPAAPARAHPAVEVGAPTSDDGGALRRALQGRAAALLACYQDGLRKQPGLEGSLVVELTLAKGGGRAREVRVAMDSLHAPALASCAVSALEGAVLPAPAAKEPAPVQVPLHFRPGGG